MYHKKTKQRKLYLGILLPVFPFQICSLGYFLACTEPLLTNCFKQKWDNYTQQNHRINVGQKTPANFHPKFKNIIRGECDFYFGFLLYTCMPVLCAKWWLQCWIFSCLGPQCSGSVPSIFFEGQTQVKQVPLPEPFSDHGTTVALACYLFDIAKKWLIVNAAHQKPRVQPSPFCISRYVLVVVGLWPDSEKMDFFPNTHEPSAASTSNA